MTDDDAYAAERRVWTIGDYAEVARRLLPASLDLVETAGIAAGDRVLDVGVGDGNTALEAARRGAIVTGIDLTPSQLDRARARAAATGLSLELQEANAEALPFADETFDVVVSVFAVIFAPDHARATAELARVCRPGGLVAITTWKNEGWFLTWRARAAALLPPPPPDAPRFDAWGEPAEVERRLRAAGLDVTVHTRPLWWDFPTAEDAVDFYLEHSGPFIAFREAAEAAGNGDRVRETLLGAVEDSNVATDGTSRTRAPYLLAIGRR